MFYLEQSIIVNYNNDYINNKIKQRKKINKELFVLAFGKNYKMRKYQN
jgi:hypothetical protein